MTYPPNSDPPMRPKPQSAGRYPSITDDDGEEFTQQTRAILAGLKEGDRRRIVARMSVTSSPPAAKVAGPILISVAASALFAIGSAAVATYVNDARGQEKQAAMSRWVQSLDADVREHSRSQMHAGAREAVASQRAQIDALDKRVKRIEDQLDAPARRQR